MPRPPARSPHPGRDRKSTRLNSSHMSISYAVFCLKKTKFRSRSPDAVNRRGKPAAGRALARLGFGGGSPRESSFKISDSTRDFYVFFFNVTATTEIYTLSLHDALPI